MRRIIVSTSIAKQRLPTRGCIAVTACVGRKGLKAICSVVAACIAIVERRRTGGGVFGADCVAKKSNNPNRCVILRGGVLRERRDTYGCVVITRSICHKRTSTVARVRVTIDVAKERSVTSGCIEAAKEIPVGFWALAVPALLKSANAPVGVFELPPTLLKRAPAPVAVFSVAVLRRSVPAPMAVLKLPSVRLRSEYMPTAVL